MLAPQDGKVVTVTAGVGSVEAFLELTDRLRVVSQEEWLAALPEQWRDATIHGALTNEMLAGAPLPPSFDDEEVQQDMAFVGTDAIPFLVAVEVACAWADEWFVADRAGRGEILDVLEDWQEWPMAGRFTAESGIWTPQLLVDDMADGTLSEGSDSYASICNVPIGS